MHKLSLDELPQFLNISKCDMSIIGSHAPLIYEVVLYLPKQMDVLLVKSDLSCICQNEQHSDKEFD